MRLTKELDEDLVGLLRFPARVSARARREPASVLQQGERHGLAAVALEALRGAGVALAPAVEAEVGMRAAARELDHAAHLRALGAIDARLAAEGLEAVALKGCLLAERLYGVPAGRATSDIDLMVAEADIERAVAALGALGYVAAEGPEEERFRREHHHLHLSSASGPPLELHFHAYRGFGGVLRSEPLIARRQRDPRMHAGGVGVLAPPDELVYLAVHAAAHRFMRLGWLYDLRLLIARMTHEELGLAASRAREVGYARIVAFTASLLREVLAVPPDALAPLGRLDPARAAVARRAVGEAPSAVRRSAGRFVYSTALADTLPSAARYAASAALGKARGLLRR